MLFFSPKLHTHLLKNKALYFVFGEILSVIYQQSLTKVYKHAEYLAIDNSTNVQTRNLDNFVLLPTVSSQMLDEILSGVYKIQLFNTLKGFITRTSATVVFWILTSFDENNISVSVPVVKYLHCTKILTQRSPSQPKWRCIQHLQAKKHTHYLLPLKLPTEASLSFLHIVSSSFAEMCSSINTVCVLWGFIIVLFILHDAISHKPVRVRCHAW